jgi:HD-GYP domain-containing protein (c-di-GMP phosphodiesterase class II)
VTVFKISGTLGFHEKETLEKLFGECRKRDIGRVVLDVEHLTSLGGGCASIIRSEAAAGGLAIGVAAAKKTVLKFLIDKNSGDAPGVVIADTVDAAISSVLTDAAGQPEAGATPAPAQPAPVEPADNQAAPAGEPPEMVGDNVLDPSVTVDRAPGVEPSASADGVDLGTDEELLADDVLESVLDPARPSTTTPSTPPPTQRASGSSDAPGDNRAAPSEESSRTAPEGDVDARELKRRIVQYNTLLSINNDFARIRDRKNLLEAFLLTTIAQVGVESAVFLQRSQGYFYPAAMRGIEADEIRGLAIEEHLFGLDDWKQGREVYTIDEVPFDSNARAPLLSLGCSYVAPFIVHGNFRGIVLLGRPLRGELDDSTIEFLKILVNQAAIAYESTSRFEEENERTLGLVQTLVSLIEENTLARGNTRMLTNYVIALAREIHYPEEHMRDLVYGTVLRDIGMIKVSDLIVRSPRELMPEEWDVIKRHPVDGADMMRRMSFSEHAVKIVLCHHERFNGEGYPNGIQGQQIPLGARVVSVVESYAAMLQERATRPALTCEEALNTLRENWGMRYDPDVVRHFIDIVEREIRTGETVANRKLELFTV